MTREWTEKYSLESSVHPLDMLTYKVNDKTDCWEWTGYCLPSGYGQLVGLGRKDDYYAHHLSYRLYHGEIPVGMCVCHSCDNPRCVNPNHLFIGTHKDNTQDAIRKGRFTQHLKPGFLRKKES